MGKPTISSNVDGNIFAVMGAASKALKKDGKKAEADEMFKRVTSSKSYDMALAIICEYVDFD